MQYLSSVHFIITLIAIAATLPFFYSDVIVGLDYFEFEKDLQNEKEILSNLQMSFSDIVADKVTNGNLIEILEDPEKIKNYVQNLHEKGLKHYSFRNATHVYPELDMKDMITTSKEFDEKTLKINELLSEITEPNENILYSWVITPDCILIRSNPDLHFERLSIFDFSKIRQWCTEINDNETEFNPYYLSPIYMSKGFPDKAVRTFLYPIFDEEDKIIGFIGVAIDWIKYFEAEHFHKLKMRPLVIEFREIDQKDGIEHKPLIISADISDRTSNYAEWKGNVTLATGYSPNGKYDERIVTSIAFYQSFDFSPILIQVVIMVVEILGPWIFHKKKYSIIRVFQRR